MGSEQSTFKETKKHKFGGYKNVDNPRPGYFITPSQIYYRGETISAIPSTFKN